MLRHVLFFSRKGALGSSQPLGPVYRDLGGFSLATDHRVSQKCLVRHIYVYPKHSEYDYNPFYACPVEEKKEHSFCPQQTTM